MNFDEKKTLVNNINNEIFFPSFFCVGAYTASDNALCGNKSLAYKTSACMYFNIDMLTTLSPKNFLLVMEFLQVNLEG